MVERVVRAVGTVREREDIMEGDMVLVDGQPKRVVGKTEYHTEVEGEHDVMPDWVKDNWLLHLDMEASEVIEICDRCKENIAVGGSDYCPQCLKKKMDETKEKIKEHRQAKEKLIERMDGFADAHSDWLNS